MRGIVAVPTRVNFYFLLQLSRAYSEIIGFDCKRSLELFDSGVVNTQCPYNFFSLESNEFNAILKLGHAITIFFDRDVEAQMEVGHGIQRMNAAEA